MSQVSEKETGYLLKWTNYLQGYKRRWFSLSNGVLSYYSNESEADKFCRGAITLSNATIILTSNTTFTISSPSGQTFHIKAFSEIDTQTWLTALQKYASKTDTGEEQNHDLTLGALQKYKEIKLKTTELSTCKNIISVRWNALKEALAEFEDTDKRTDVEKNSILFQVTCEAFIGQCNNLADFILSDWHKVLQCLDQQQKHQRRLQSMMETLVKRQLYVVDDAMKRRKMLPGGDGECLFLEEIFYDALESSDPSQVHNVNVCSLMSENEKTEDKEQTNMSSEKSHRHRTRLPKQPSRTLQIWSILKQFSGGDLAKLSMPVEIAEPLSMLQRITEEFEYSKILDEAAACQDSCLQLAYVATFAATNYASSSNRCTKPFNPLLGETFELDRWEELGWRCISEQVSHHPPITSQHCESKLWVMWRTFSVTSKFKGNYIQINPVGTTHLTFHSTGDHYTWDRVVTTVNNIIVGKLWIEHFGDMTIKNEKTGDTCILKFKQSRYFSSDNYRQVEGLVMNKTGNVKWKIMGTWDKAIEIVPNRENKKSKPIKAWEANPPNPGMDEFYNFSKFACQLNEPEQGVAPTDSRNRPDQRLMEEGRWDKANAEKVRLERKQRISQGSLMAKYKPMWFQKNRNTNKGVEYVFNNKYWSCKKNQDWSNCPNIF